MTRVTNANNVFRSFWSFASFNWTSKNGRTVFVWWKCSGIDVNIWIDFNGSNIDSTAIEQRAEWTGYNSFADTAYHTTSYQNIFHFLCYWTTAHLIGFFLIFSFAYFQKNVFLVVAQFRRKCDSLLFREVQCVWFHCEKMDVQFDALLLCLICFYLNERRKNSMAPNQAYYTIELQRHNWFEIHSNSSHS